MTSPQSYEWHPLHLLRANFQSNVDALATRMPELAGRLREHKPSGEYFLSTSTGTISIAVSQNGQLHLWANPVPPNVAQQVTKQAFPAGQCTAPVMVVGLDQGWLWKALADLPCNVPGVPGHRPPLYLLCRDIERLWVVLHLQTWQSMLNDSRFLLFVGGDAIEQVKAFMQANTIVPWPRACLNVDPTLWPAGLNLDGLLAQMHQQVAVNLQATQAAVNTAYAGLTPAAIADRIRSGRPLRVMGITSRYTTFLQHSMRDWLSAFERMGHETRLVIEQADHEVLNNIIYAEASRDFQPDLLLIIDHYRSEFQGLPTAVPCVMWVQDNLPNIFNAKAGAAQGPLDFCIGFSRHYMVREFGYPHDRYLPAPVGVNTDRFAPAVLSKEDTDRYACDVSYVGHASKPADLLMQDQLSRVDVATAALLRDIFDQMRAHYDNGGGVLGRPSLLRMVEQTAAARSLQVGEQLEAIAGFFTHTIGNALFRHQTLHWLADMDVNVHLYGRGWEDHPRFSRFARGVADNRQQLVKIYQASKINLQVIPHGAVHQRMLDGLAAGGFFLVRHSVGDEVGRHHKQLWEYCQAHGITSNEQLQATAANDPALRQLLREIDILEGYAELPREYDVFSVNQVHADTGFLVAAASVWPEYDQVAFASKAQLEERIAYFLPRPEERQRLAMAMREPVIRHCSYQSINQRLLDMIASQLDGAGSVTARAA